MRSRKENHSEGQCRVACSLLHRRAHGRVFLSQRPWPTFVKTLYTCVLLKPTPPNSLNLAWKVLKGDTVRLQPWFIIRRVSWLYIVAYTNGCIKITKVTDYIGDYHILSGDGKFWYGIWCLSVWEASSAVGMLPPWLPGTQSKAHWECKMEFPSFSRWSQPGLFLSLLTICLAAPSLTRDPGQHPSPSSLFTHHLVCIWVQPLFQGSDCS